MDDGDHDDDNINNKLMCDSLLEGGISMRILAREIGGRLETKVQIQGWVKTVRQVGKLTFIAVGDYLEGRVIGCLLDRKIGMTTTEFDPRRLWQCSLERLAYFSLEVDMAWIFQNTYQASNIFASYP